jgi:hypothetical protein
MQFAAGIGRDLHSDHATAAKALVSSFQGLTRHDYVFRSALVLTDALAGHADDLVEQLTHPPRRAGCAHSGGAGPYHTAREAAAQASMLADAPDTARPPDSHVQEDADRVDAERGFRPWWAMHRRAPIADNTGEVLNRCMPRASIRQR